MERRNCCYTGCLANPAVRIWWMGSQQGPGSSQRPPTLSSWTTWTKDYYEGRVWGSLITYLNRSQLTCFRVFAVRGAGFAGALRLRRREALHLGRTSNHINFFSCNPNNRLVSERIPAQAAAASHSTLPLSRGRISGKHVPHRLIDCSWQLLPVQTPRATHCSHW